MFVTLVKKFMKNFKPIIFLLFLLLITSGCSFQTGSIQTQNRTFKHNEAKSEQTQNEQEVIATTSRYQTIAPNDVIAQGNDEWKKYQNGNYKFNIKFPASWFLYNCLNDFWGVEPKLNVHISNNKIDDCNTPGGRINIIISKDKDFYKYKSYDHYVEKEIVVGNIKANRITGYYEKKGDEGETLRPRPLINVALTIIPYEDKYIILSYSELYKFIGDTSKGTSGFRIEENFESVYNDIVSSFEFQSDAKKYENKNFKFKFNYHSIYEIIDRTKQQSKTNDLPWYQQSDFLLLSLSFVDQSSINNDFNFKILNTEDENKIKASGGWEICERTSDEEIGGKKVKVFLIDKGASKIKLITSDNKSFIFIYSKAEEEVNLIIKNFSKY
jgi:hypothetical protein